MALRIPVETLPGVAPGQLPDARVSPNAPLEAFGGGAPAAGAFHAAQSLSQDVTGFAMETQQQDDLADVMRATAALTDKATDMQFNPETGFLAKKGDQVRDLQPKVREDWTKTVTDLSGTLRNDRQRMMFQKQADERWGHLNGVLAGHTLRERENYIAQQTGAMVKAATNAGALAARIGDYNGLTKAAGDVESSLRVSAEKNGISPQARDKEVADHVSTVYSEAIQSLLTSGQDLSAKSVFEKYGDKLTENDKQKLEPHMLEGSSVGEAQRLVAGLFSRAVDYTQDGRETGPVYSSEKELLDAVDKATENASPLVKSKAESLAIRRYNVEKTSQREDMDATYQKLVDGLRKTGDLESVQNSHEYATLNEDDKRQLENTAARIAKDGTPYARVSDPTVTADFFSKNRDQVAQMSKADLLRLASKVTEAKYNDIEKHWNAARQKEDDAEFKTTKADDERIFDAIKNSQIVDLQNVKGLADLKKDQNKKKSEAYQPIWDEALNAYKNFFHENGKNPNQEQKEQILKDMMIEKALKKPQTFMQKYGPYAGVLTGAPVLGAAIGYGYSKYRGQKDDVAISDQERSDIRDAIIRVGGNPTDEKILLLKRAKMMGASLQEREKLAGQ